ncbi:centrosomal protein of 68 kDa [Denticeps clupeoides]|uniref:Centrosomal protein of 68 kDa n=1 Tax=Denticeps clupeoides TaxID=299321 RepID=A0AAY4DK51_9TELE|nr:centrosomal protein of 68 kDa [Denticeps clupeoides]XP_028844314.1 centrosomal protein of 68 kDa [Denticeps clupeoides]
MALAVDRTTPKRLCPMEQVGRWKTRIPEFIRSGHPDRQCNKQGTREGTQATSIHAAREQSKEKISSKKTVTMAPTSTYMTSRGQYIARKPFYSTERQISILKNPIAPGHLEQKKHLPGSSCEKQLLKETGTQCKASAKECALSPGFSDILSSSASREDLASHLSTFDLRTGLSYEEPIFSSTPTSSFYNRRSLSSPPLDVYNLTVPLSPRWTYTQRSASASHHAPMTQRSRADVPRKDPGLRTNKSKASPLLLEQMSPNQANYWACAIPGSLPPSPDRRSSNWDPDKEYQALLDYTYPLRPGHLDKWDLSDTGSLLQKDPVLQDSGIELDKFCSSSTLSCLDQPSSHQARLGSSTVGQRSYDLHSLSLRGASHSRSENGRLSSSMYSSVDPIGLSVDTLDSEVKHDDQWARYQKLGVFSKSQSAPMFIPTLRILPHPDFLQDWDDEFLSLPEQLQEIQALSQQLKDIIPHMGQPVTSSWESLEQETSSTEQQMTETTAAQGAEVELEGEESVCEAPQRSEGASEEVKLLDSGLQMLSSDMTQDSVREVESIMERLQGISLSQMLTPMDLPGEAETKESLMQHIKTFCTHLDELIQWLYKVVAKMEVLSPPCVNLESVKSSLAEYKSFQQEVHAHQTLTMSVLQTGEILLRCMNSASTALKDTLLLIERQSRALETHAEHLFCSILSAMDKLTDPSNKESTGEQSTSVRCLS